MTLTSTTLRPHKNTLTSKWDILFEEAPKEWIGFKPNLGDQTYVCYACRHMFSYLTSFQDHVNRRILVLKYNCPGCPTGVLTFYNRCALLIHTRKHYSLTEGKVNLQEIDILTLPVSLAGFLPHPNISLLYPAEEPKVAETVYVNSQFYSPDISEKGKQIVTLKPTNIIFKQSDKTLALKQVCAVLPKCEFVTLEVHEQLRRQNLEENNNIGDDAEIKQEPVEEEDPPPTITMPVITKVESLTQKKKFRLPRCLDCDMPQKVTMAEHYLGINKPFNISLKCSICKFIASTKCSLKAHVRIHENTPPFVCPDCGKDFPIFTLLRKHMDDVCFHLAKQVRYRCPGKRCGKLFALSSTFALHFQVHLKCFVTCSVCSYKTLKPEDAEAHKVYHGEQLCHLTKLYDCPLCPGETNLTEDTFKEHVDAHTTDIKRCMYVYMCKHCRSYFRSTSTYATHLLKCASKQTVHVRKYDIPRYVTRDCEKCTNKIIFNENRPATLCNRCKTQPVSVPSKRYFCILCNKQIQFNEKGYHRKQCKYGKPLVVVPRLVIEDVDNSSFCSSGSDFSSSRRKSSDSWKTDEGSKKKRKRVNNSSLNKQRKVEVEFDLTAEEPVQFDGTYRCKLCDYENTDRVGFHVHIKEHRDISTAYQCMECGECFVVKPSLVKHLLHFHNISDAEMYLNENDCFDVVAVKELENIMKLAPGESKEPVKENQCRVCRQEFLDPLSLNKHFRIHGMAFLMKNTK